MVGKRADFGTKAPGFRPQPWRFRVAWTWPGPFPLWASLSHLQNAPKQWMYVMSSLWWLNGLSCIEALQIGLLHSQLSLSLSLSLPSTYNDRDTLGDPHTERGLGPLWKGETRGNAVYGTEPRFRSRSSSDVIRSSDKVTHTVQASISLWETWGRWHVTARKVTQKINWDEQRENNLKNYYHHVFELLGTLFHIMYLLAFPHLQHLKKYIYLLENSGTGKV